MDPNETHRKKKTRCGQHKNDVYCIELILVATPLKIAVKWPPTSSRINHSSKKNKTSGALLEKKGQT